MAEVNKVEVNGETLIDLSTDTVTEETLDEGITAHDAAGNPIMGKRSTANVQYVPQTLTPEQQAQARENIGVVDIPTSTEQRNFLDWDGVTTDGEQYDQAYRVTTYAPNLRDVDEADVSGTLVLKSLDGALTNLVSFPSDDVMFNVSSTELTVYFKSTGTLALYIKSYSYGTGTNASDGVYLGKGYMPFEVTEGDHTWQDTREGYVTSVIINGLNISENDVISPAVLPGDIVRAVRTDTPDLVLVSDGAGGTKWVTKEELGGAEEELPPDSDIVVEPGEPGWTYVPNLSAEGYLGFTPTKFDSDEGPTEVPPVNIRGPQGPAGPAYELTEEDKTKIVEAVKSEPLFDTDATLKLENGVLGVNTATDAEQDNTLPITSAAVYETLGNIEILLGTI